MSKISWRKYALTSGGYLLGIGGFLCSMPQTAQAFQLSLGLQQRYTQTTFSVLSTGGSLVYQGPGYVGEVRLRFLGSSTRDINDLTSGPGLDVFGFGGYFIEDNPATVLSDSRVNTVYGLGMDFRISCLFVGMQFQNNASTITTTQSIVTFGFPTYGARFGANIPLNKTESLVLSLGGIVEMGRTPSTSSGVWYATSMTGFASIGFRLLNFDNALSVDGD